MRLCAGIRVDGGRCQAPAMRESSYCLNHDPSPSEAEARRKRASKGGKRGGRGRPITELSPLKVENADIRKKLLAGQLQPGVASVAIQSINVDVRMVATQLKVRVQEELIERVEALEAALDARNEGSTWSA